MFRIIKENINGVLGTVIFHLMIIVIIMATRLSSVNHQDEHSMLIEFHDAVTEEEFLALTESLQMQESYLSEDESGQIRRNIAVDISEERPVADQFKNMSSEEMSKLDQRVNEVLNNAANGNMPEPEQPEIEFEQPSDIFQHDPNNDKPYTGPTTITYDLPGRTHLRMPVPVYKCPEGGIVEVKISVDQQGIVINATIDGAPGNFNETCIFNMAMEAAMGSRFSEKSDAQPVQSGTITFYFQTQ